MYRNAVCYRGLWLAPGSNAIKLYEEKKFKELDQIVKQVEAEDRAEKAKNVEWLTDKAG